LLTYLKQIGAWLDRIYLAIMPGFWLRLTPNFQWAGAIALVAALWIGSRQVGWIMSSVFMHGSTSESGEAAQAKTIDMPLVRVASLQSSLRDATITVRGRTQALHEVDTRAQVEGVVDAIHYEKGQKVRQGDVLCEIKLNDRGARAAQAQASVDQMGKELSVAQELYKDGFRSKTQMAAAQANYEQAKAGLSAANIAVSNTKIRAPFDGIVDERYVDVGDYMRAGDKCEMVIAPEPFLAVGAVSEDDVGKLKVGDPVSATLVTGETVDGKIHFVADRSDQTTRTFRLEVELPNPDAKLRDGVSADIHIPVRQTKAILISPAILVLDDQGAVGVRAIVEGRVHFFPVKIIEDSPNGMWIAGLPDRVTVITVGQQFVQEGERVKAQLDKSGPAS
jgi:membrane fusion protein, multidrug efflux system